MPSTSSDFIIYGHRGCILVANSGENTVEAVRRGLEDGVDGIEFDVYAVKDAGGFIRLIVIHDDDVDRTTDGHGAVADKSFERLRALDAGNGWKIPTAEEVIDTIAEYRTQTGKPIKANVELKGPATAEPVSGLLRRCIQEGWVADDFLVSSFDHEQLKQFHGLMPEIPTAVLVDDAQWEAYDHSIIPAINLAHELGSVSINPGLSFSSPELVRQIHASGLKVYIWTGASPTMVEKSDEHVLAIRSYGADGVFANNPGSARTALEKDV